MIIGDGSTINKTRSDGLEGKFIQESHDGHLNLCGGSAPSGFMLLGDWIGGWQGTAPHRIIRVLGGEVEAGEGPGLGIGYLWRGAPGHVGSTSSEYWLSSDVPMCAMRLR